MTLDELIPRYIAAGYQVQARTETTAQLVKGRSVNTRDVLMTGVFSVFFAKPEAVYLTVVDGAIVGGRPGRFVCGRCGRIQGYWKNACNHCGAKYAEHPPLAA